MANLKLTRFVHSCLLVETDEAVVLFDPGIYSFESGTFSVDHLSRLDHIVITHEHADHFHLPFVEILLAKFPEAKIIATQSVVNQLGGKGQASSQPTEAFKFFEAPHEKLPEGMGEPPQNLGVHFLDVLSNPGDSHSFFETKQVLAMPMTAPWGSMTTAVNKISELRPKVVMPIHDWHWKPEVAHSMYERFAGPLSSAGINFILPVDGQAVELNLL